MADKNVWLITTLKRHDPTGVPNINGIYESFDNVIHYVKERFDQILEAEHADFTTIVREVDKGVANSSIVKIHKLVDARSVSAREESPLKQWQIWMEGWRVTGEHHRAQWVGDGVGETFREAVLEWYSRTKDKHFNVVEFTIYGCRLFDNETDARKSFG